MNDVAQDGLGEITDQPFPKASPVHVDELDNYYTHNVDKAKQLLAEGGYPNGFSFGMVIPGGGIQNMESQAAAIQQQLKKINVNAKVIRILPEQHRHRLLHQRHRRRVRSRRAGVDLPRWIVCTATTGSASTSQHMTTPENPQIDALMLKAQSTTDINETYKFVRQAVDIAVKQALDIPIAFAPQFNAYNASRVSGTVGAQTNICDPPDLTQVKVTG